jgi:hypothetical protein
MGVYKDDEFKVMINITKSNDENVVSGWANVSKNADGTNAFDWQGDIIPIEALEKAAIDFMIAYRGSGEQHVGGVVATVVESIVFTKEKMAAIGIPEGTIPEGWFITVKVPPDVFAKVKGGQYRMFSIQGRAKRLSI